MLKTVSYAFKEFNNRKFNVKKFIYHDSLNLLAKESSMVLNLLLDVVIP